MNLSAPRLDDLVLARVGTSTRPPSADEVARALRPLAPATFDDARWAGAIRESLERLQPAAASEIARRFGVTGAVTWKRIAERVVPGLALGIPPADARSHGRLKDRDQWAAAIVGRALGLWRQGPPPSLPAVCDALVWRALSLGGTPKRTPPEIRAHFVSQVFPAGAGSAERTIRLLAASQVGAPRADLRALREALVRRWLVGQDWEPAAPDFAAAVRDAADHATDGVFGERKVFIRNVWRTLRAHPAFGSLALDEFKHRLIDAHKAGLVTLARADLVAAMDPEAVRESETSHLEARYHFVEKGTP
jgi:hypothetical protein